MGKYEAPEPTFLPDNGQDIIVMSTPDNNFDDDFNLGL